MGITYLTHADFVILGSKTKTLGIKPPGTILVWYKIQGDPYCQQFEPIFAKLSSADNRINFAVLDVSRPDGREVVALSRSTSTPITGVPLLILYANGRPYAKFNGTRSMETIRDFITSSLRALMAPAKQVSAPAQFMPSQQGMYGSGNDHSDAVRMPDNLGPPPSMKGKIKGTISTVDSEEDHTLATPIAPGSTPHNIPWESGLVGDM